MPYEMNVEAHHKLMYGNSVIMVAQQMKDPLRDAVTIVPVSGEAVSVADLFGKVSRNQGEGRGRRNPENPVKATRRWLVMPDNPLETGQYIDKEDKFKMATDPTSNFVRAHTAQIVREYSDVVLGVTETAEGVYAAGTTGILGLAREGKVPGAGTGLPAGQVIAHGGLGLTLDKLRGAVKKLKKADFGIDARLDPLFGYITPDQEDDLLGIAAASGPALNTFTIEQLKSGKPTMLMGITWLLSNRLPKNGTTRTCAIWAKSNIIVGEWEPIKGDMWNDTSAKNLPYVYVSARLDATRAQDKGVVAIECTEAA